MAFLAAVPAVWMWAATAVSAAGSLYKGAQARKAGEEAKMQAEQQAKAEQAMAQRAAGEERRRARFVRSRALAVAGASGAGVSDPTVVSILGDIGAEGEYRALTALYGGDERALSLRMQGNAARNEGRAGQTAGFMQAASTIFSTASGPTMAQKYSI